MERTSHCQLNGQDGVAIAMADSVTATIERAHIIHNRTGSHEMTSWRSAADEVRWVARVYSRLVLDLLSTRILVHLLLRIACPWRAAIGWRLGELRLLGLLAGVVVRPGAVAHVQREAHVRRGLPRRRRTLLLWGRRVRHRRPGLGRRCAS